MSESSFRTISAPAFKACSLPLATERDKGAMPQLVQGYNLSASTNLSAFRKVSANRQNMETRSFLQMTAAIFSD